MHTKFVVFAFFVCGTYTYEKCKIYKLRLHILNNGGQKIFISFLLCVWSAQICSPRLYRYFLTERFFLFNRCTWLKFLFLIILKNSLNNEREHSLGNRIRDPPVSKFGPSTTRPCKWWNRTHAYFFKSIGEVQCQSCKGSAINSKAGSKTWKKYGVLSGIKCNTRV